MSDDRKTLRIPVGPLVAAIGAVLLIVSLFLDWYGARTAFTVFEVLDLVLVLAALATIAQLAGGMGLFKPPASPPVALAVTLFALFVVVTQVIDHPPAGVGVDKDTGIWLALAGAGVMVVGAVLATAHISIGVDPRSQDAPTGSEPRREHDPTRPISDPPGGEREP